jgi:PPOX class probable F420-dependent enzyme
MRLHEKACQLIGSGVDATLVTLNADGSPQTTVVWMALQPGPDGDELVTAHFAEYKKVRNIRRDPRVAVTILFPDRRDELAPFMNLAGTTPYLAITGTARIVEGGARELLADLAPAMLGERTDFPPPDAPPGMLTRIRIHNVGGLGPWA